MSPLFAVRGVYWRTVRSVIGVSHMAGENKTARPRVHKIEKLTRRVYEAQLLEQQRRLQRIQQAYLQTDDRAIVVLEGHDAAGKGGAIRRMSLELDPRSFRVWPIAAPNELERRNHYLQRFWVRLPERGQIAVFDRSWYGRVLVERVEEFAQEHEWRRAYREIIEFERKLVDDGARVIKVFLSISEEEQLRRFRERAETPRKRWKLSEEDFRNRKKRTHYDKAVSAMLNETSTARAPWHVIPADDKLGARVETLRCIADAASSGLEFQEPELPPKLRELIQSELGIET